MMLGGGHMTGHLIFLTAHVTLSGHTAVPSLVKEYSETHTNTLGPSADEDIVLISDRERIVHVCGFGQVSWSTHSTSYSHRTHVT